MAQQGVDDQLPNLPGCSSIFSFLSAPIPEQLTDSALLSQLRSKMYAAVPNSPLAS